MVPRVFGVAGNTRKGRFMRTRLKLFVEQDEQPTANVADPDAAIELGKFALVIGDAVAWDRTWLQDFANEQIIVSQDLYEIIRMYEETRQIRA